MSCQCKDNGPVVRMTDCFSSRAWPQITIVIVNPDGNEFIFLQEDTGEFLFEDDNTHFTLLQTDL